MGKPFAALDALTRRQMHHTLLDIWAKTKKTIVFVTHDIGEAIMMADRIAVMSKGPRSKLREIIPVTLSRPRDQSASAFGNLYKKIESLIVHEVAE